VKRRLFLQFLGLAPAAAVAPKVAEAVERVQEVAAPAESVEVLNQYGDILCTTVAVPFTVKDLPGYVFSRRR
jgi:hypothetical protein